MLSIYRPRIILSGGETGAEIGALVAARKCRIPTGGYTLPGYQTAAGDQRDVLAGQYQLLESESPIEQNVAPAQLLVLFAPMAVDRVDQVKRLAEEHQVETLIIDDVVEMAHEAGEALRATINNVEPGVIYMTGNTEAELPGVASAVRDIVATAFSHYHYGPHTTTAS